MENTGDQSIQFELTTLNQALQMMEQRTQDLRTAENVAMQSIPMIKTMAFSNYCYSSDFQAGACTGDSS